jgi:hypothetical protein
VVKAVHAAFFLLFNALLAGLIFEVLADRITGISTVACALFVAETGILMANRWRCPLTVFAERLGSHSGRITDAFLPPWVADRAFQIYGVLYGLAIAGFALRLIR